MAALFDYEALVADFNQKLVTQLRSHSTDTQFLETWVPDEDPVKSILNMVESARSAGCDRMRIRFTETTMNSGKRQELLAAISELGTVHLAIASGSYELNVSAPASEKRS